MAHAQLETIIANPARKHGRKAKKNMAKRMSLKQKLHFGTARVRAAAKAALKRKRKKNSAHSARQTFFKRSTRKPTNKAMGYRGSAGWKKSTAKKTNPKRKCKRRNIGELIAITLGNPATKKRRTTVAKTKYKKNTPRRHSNPAGRRKRKSNKPSAHHRRRQNPGGRIMEIVKSGVSVVAGAVGTKLATQAVLGPSNTGVLGYAANAVATGLAAWAVHSFTKDKTISQGVLVGGAVQIILRVVNDYTPYGQMLALSGLGDYQVSAFPTPSWYPAGLRSPNPANPWAGAPAINSSGAGVSGTPNWN